MRVRIAFIVKGCPVHTQTPFPGGLGSPHQQQPSGDAEKLSSMAPARHVGRSLQDRTSGSFQRHFSKQLVWGQSEGSEVWHLCWLSLLLCIPHAVVDHSCTWLHSGAAPTHPQPAHLSNALQSQLVMAFPNCCILFMLNEMFLKHILRFSLRRP